MKELTVERGLVLHGIQAQQPTVMERVVLRWLADQIAQTFQLTEKETDKPESTETPVFSQPRGSKAALRSVRQESLKEKYLFEK